MKEIWKDKIVVITGATSGIGKATAHLFASHKAIVILCGRDNLKGKQVENEIMESGGKAKFLQCDVMEEKQVKKMIEKIINEFKTIDVLFNNAGIMLPSMEIENMPIEDWKKTFSVNTNGIFFVTKYSMPYLLESRGTIINNASIAGLSSYVVGRSYAYSASKAAVIQLSHLMAKNYGKYGIRVNCICPGIIDTPILGDRDRGFLASRIPLGYVGEPEVVADVVLFLASEKARYLTGVVLPIDGGASL